MQLTDQNFKQEILDFNGCALVDFFAVWCGPCQVQGPIIDELAEEMGNQVKVAKIDVDKAQAIAEKYNVMSVPTIIIFKNGEVKKIMNGLQNKGILTEVIKGLL